ncbi:MAG: glycosyltransferase family 2 protein [Myxococcales bacterium]|nr:glycosyltransferase family 2 protein [Myxococcales bacterium]
MSFRPCAIVPTYDNPMTIRSVVTAAQSHLSDVIVVDDGSGGAGRDACAQIASEGLALVRHRECNGGKGAAVRTGFELAQERGFTHAFQIDADGQHALERIPEFLAAAREHPEALILGYPEFDASAPRSRRVARKITNFWVNLEVGRGVIYDAMVGFRVYPLAAAAQVPVRGRRMDFDIEIAVRLAWAKVPIINLPVAVRYLSADEGGVSHFRNLRDNLRFAWLHSRLCSLKATLFFLRLFGLRRRT